MRALLVFAAVLVVTGCPPPRMEEAQVKNGVQFRLESEPGGADVVVDGKPMGLTPTTVVLSPREHALKLTHSGYFTLETTIFAASGGTFHGKLVASH